MDLPHVDPLRPHSPLARALFAFGRSGAGRWYGIHVASPVDAFLLKRTGGKLRLTGPLPTAVLTTTGARSGAKRENPVVYFHDADDVILIASSFGREKHPAWYHNLRAHHDVLLNGHSFRATDVTDDGEYERLYGLAEQLYPGYADYRARATAIGRRIPVLRLTPP